MHYSDEEILEYSMGNDFAFYAWRSSYESFNASFTCYKSLFYDRFIKPIENKRMSLQEKCIELQNTYRGELDKYISLYDKDKLLVGLFTIKEYITKDMTNLISKSIHITEEQSVINLLIFLIYNREYQDKGHSLYTIDTESNSFLNDIFTYARWYNLLFANMERIEDVDESRVSLADMAFTTVETPSFHDYFDEFESLGSEEKIEEYQILDQNVKMQVERLKISLNDIRQKSDRIIYDVFGFHLNTLECMMRCTVYTFLTQDISDFYKYIHDKDEYYNVIPIPIEILYELANKNNIKRDELNNIIKLFSINQKEEKAIELSCFYLNDDNICFGICDFMQTSCIFEKFALSGAHLQYYNNEDHNYINLLNSSQKDMSKYLCFVMADVLLKNGYKLPTEVFSYNDSRYKAPKVEIDNITYEKRNILKDLGDCDVLFLSESSASIICIEFKYFVPSVTYKELKKTDRNKITKQIYEKLPQIQNREKALKDNIPYLIDFMGGKPQNYSVRTIIVLARPNMYVFSDEIKGRIPYEFMTMNEFIKKADDHYF